jgi:hypothetical protein
MRHLNSNRHPRQSHLAEGLYAIMLLLSAHSNAAIYSVGTVADAGPASLRQAILDANLTTEADLIHFNIPGPGVKTINLLTQLPAISRSLTIDGYTQPGASANTLNTFEGGLNTVLQIELVGAGGFYGLYIEAGNGVILTVQGLNLHGFIAGLLGAAGPGTSQIRSFGNFLCTNIDGNAIAAGPFTGFGIATQRTPSFIGGDLPWQRNLISGCLDAGVRIDGDAQVRGNLIGTDASASQALGNLVSNLPGVIIYNTEAQITIGGSTATARNLISGNRTFGVGVIKGSPGPHYANLKIIGNYIGTDWQGSNAIPNGFATANLAQFGGGIQISSNSTDVTPLIIGGFAPGEGNLIAFNRGSGIFAANNSVGEAFDSRGNAIYGQSFGGATNIDIGAFGITANDAGDPDLGANAQQNTPEILAVSESFDQAVVTYRVDTLPANASYPLRVDFYVGTQGGSGAWLAQDSYPSSAAGQARQFSFTLAPGMRGFPLTAIASSAGHSSELAPVYDKVFRNGFESFQ